MAALHPSARLAGRSRARAWPALDIVRVLAALAVVLFHYRTVRTPGDTAVAALQAWPAFDSLVAHGYLGVDVFFALSGFLLVMPWARHACHDAPLPDWRRFYLRRARRIVPAYYVHLLFLFAVAAPLLLGAGFMAANAAPVAFNIFAHATFLQYTTPASAGSLGLNGALWTLTLEAQFYVLLPWIAPEFVRRPLRWTLAAIALAIAWRWVAHHNLGAVVSWQLALGQRWAIPESAVRDLIATQLPGFAGQFALGMAAGTAWVRARRPECGPVRHRDAPAPQAIRGAALASYAAYLWHLPILLFWNRLRVLDGSGASLPAYLLVVCVVAWLSCRWVERPFLGEATKPAPL